MMALSLQGAAMKVEGHTIIITTPEDLLPLITEALKLAGIDKAAPFSGECGETTRLNRPKRKLLSPKDVEYEYGLTRKTLAYWRMEGMGPPFSNCGKLVYYEREELDKFIASTKIHTTGYAE